MQERGPLIFLRRGLKLNLVYTESIDSIHAVTAHHAYDNELSTKLYGCINIIITVNTFKIVGRLSPGTARSAPECVLEVH